MLIPHDPIRETLHALTRSAVYGMFASLLAPTGDAVALANQFEQAYNLAGTVAARLPFSWSTSSLLAAVALARSVEPAELLRLRAECLGGGVPGTALDRVDDEPGAPLAAQRVARAYERLGFVPQSDLPADHLAQHLMLLRWLAEREADAEHPAARLDLRRQQSEFIDRHPGPRALALANAAAGQAGRCPFAGVLVALAQWLQRDRRWLGDAAGPATPPA